MRGFVPLYLGIESLTREDIINNHTRPLAKSLFNANNGQLILVLDGTYVYIQKSNNFSFQRRTYSMHKGRPLVKPMVIVTTTGYFVTIMGPYFADSKNNDASILNHMLKTNTEEIRNFVQEDDVFVVDRGFRDSLSLLEDLGIRAEMPSFINKGQKQMPCEDANNSRFVTKIRWVVESANARIKSWKYFNYVLPTNQIPYIGDYLRIVCALSNKYFQPLCSPHSEDGDTRLASRMLSLSSGGNTLKSYVEANNLERRSALWKPVSDVVLDNFPRFTEEQLRSLTCGVYQLKMSSSYIQEHLDGNCDIQVHADDNDLLRVWIQSRHTSSRKYLLWIRYSLSDIIAWYCKCRAGERVVGMCSHIASVVWYLSYARHLESNIYGVQNWGEYLADASKIPEPIDLSDSESEASIIEE
ncbi:uncharacterized protein LOC123566193 [Mercenaria mercenaria]|uniref:uncharacterized protein LOC123566193 n=1 Tax=Mercenaria mercenaria TaxID=6596 RepID=UPI00234E6502|nr:uncharacterized protein LOC123566193 [Mercenaria mercenaria]